MRDLGSGCGRHRNALKDGTDHDAYATFSIELRRQQEEAGNDQQYCAFRSPGPLSRGDCLSMAHVPRRGLRSSGLSGLAAEHHARRAAIR